MTHLGDGGVEFERSDFGCTAPWENLQLRSKILRQLRTFFDEAGFLEVETPLLSADTVVDRNIDPFPVYGFSDGLQPKKGPTYWLQTSPEFAMKRMLADAYARQLNQPSDNPHDLAIFQVARVFRAGEIGHLHNPEFSMVEWYRQNQSYADAMAWLSELVNSLLGLGQATQVTYRQAFEDAFGVANIHVASVDDLRKLAVQKQLHYPDSLENADRDDWLNFLLAEVIEPRLGDSVPAILCDYPASQSALAETRRDEAGTMVACRFELYVRGIELANGYHELLDAEELLRRNRNANQQRQLDGKYELPTDSRLVAAMRNGLPRCSGIALGLDRLVMLAANANHIDQVIAFPWNRA